MKQPRTADPRIAAEVAASLAAGCRQLTIAGMSAEVGALGYRFARDRDSRCENRYLTGPRAGANYPACNLSLVQADDGKSAFHYQARRDENFHRLQALRGEIFAVHSCRIYTM
ncbi:hypothetical protein [Paraburkholderia youngii]|uniref:hypothetical protein n=1 Tax=Paraburkholderia youngii TaxID=2782701 RepID=UPI003D2555C6